MEGISICYPFMICSWVQRLKLDDMQCKYPWALWSIQYGFFFNIYISDAENMQTYPSLPVPHWPTVHCLSKILVKTGGPWVWASEALHDFSHVGTWVVLNLHVSMSSLPLCSYPLKMLFLHFQRLVSKIKSCIPSPTFLVPSPENWGGLVLGPW